MRVSWVVLLASTLWTGMGSYGQSPELRGIWMTPRSSNGFWSKADIGRAMDTVADNHFNIVYFNAWSRGWPLWRSEVFYNETGYYSDPAAGDRDILQEAVAEAHRRGLEIEAWMEYGFVAWWSGNSLAGFPQGPLLGRHTGWVARMSNGSDQFPSGHSGVFYWMSHNHPEVQEFMVKLHQEIVQRYDVDGIELDRIRYPQLDCGYDSVSVALYRREKGVDPPANTADPVWMRWRADQLAAFHRVAYDSIKRANGYATVSNAPSHYSSGPSYPAYQSYLQDWRAWLNNGSLDAAQIQMYVHPSILQVYIPSALSGLQDSVRKKAYAGIALRTSDFTATPSEALSLISVTRNAGLRGNSVWYYTDVQELGYFGLIKAQAYQTRVAVPDRPAGWRGEVVLLDETQATVSGSWTKVALPQGSQIMAWEKTFSYCQDDTARAYEYRVDVSAGGWYEVYAYQVGNLLNLTSQAPFELHEGSGGSFRTILVDQSRGTSAGWYKLGDVLLAKGDNQLVIRLTNANIGQGKFVVADAVMLILNRRLSPTVTSVETRGESVGSPSRLRLLASYPNPFNSSTQILFEVPARTRVRLDVYDTLGRIVLTLVNGTHEAGSYTVRFGSSGLPSGLYLVGLHAPPFAEFRKVLLIK